LWHKQVNDIWRNYFLYKKKNKNKKKTSKEVIAIVRSQALPKLVDGIVRSQSGDGHGDKTQTVWMSIRISPLV
jgi:hypothetical protein